MRKDVATKDDIKDMTTKQDIARLEKKVDETKALQRLVDDLRRRLDRVEEDLSSMKSRN